MQGNLFDNQIRDPVFDQFNHLYGERLFSICPFLSKFLIKILPLGDLIDAQIITEEDAAFQAYLNHIEKMGEDASETRAYITKNEAIIRTLGLTLEEQYSAIAHEIGHILFFFHSIKDGAGGQGEEIIADGYACTLGLKDSLLSVLNKLLGTTWYSEEIYRQIAHRIYWIEHFYN